MALSESEQKDWDEAQRLAVELSRRLRFPITGWDEAVRAIGGEETVIAVHNERHLPNERPDAREVIENKWFPIRDRFHLARVIYSQLRQLRLHTD